MILFSMWGDAGFHGWGIFRLATECAFDSFNFLIYLRLNPRVDDAGEHFLCRVQLTDSTVVVTVRSVAFLVKYTYDAC
jgi:hypothetical protein